MEKLVGSPRLLRLFKWVQSSGVRQINHKADMVSQHRR